MLLSASLFARGFAFPFWSVSSPDMPGFELVGFGLIFLHFRVFSVFASICVFSCCFRVFSGRYPQDHPTSLYASGVSGFSVFSCFRVSPLESAVRHLGPSQRHFVRTAGALDARHGAAAPCPHDLRATQTSRAGDLCRRFLCCFY